MAKFPQFLGARKDRAEPPRGGGAPAWIGLGAQRCGTTWFTEMLCRHPAVAMPRGVRKEAHWFDRFLVDPFTEETARAYRALFPAVQAAGEFTPAYLRSPWVPPLLRAACGDAPLLIVLLRDPIDRFRSALRWSAAREPVPPATDARARDRWIREMGNLASWGGMYATQLAQWLEWFPRERFVVLQYERVLAEPAVHVERLWRALGLDPVPLDDVSAATWNSTPEAAASAAVTVPASVEPALRALYEPEVRRLADGWGIDRALWRHFG